jgi:hypothetical protein
VPSEDNGRFAADWDEGGLHPGPRPYERFRLARGSNQGKSGGGLHAWLNLNKEMHQAMTKSLEAIIEAIRNPKHPFRKVDNQPKKPLKHRYERRKIRSYLRFGDWVSGEAT